MRIPDDTQPSLYDEPYRPQFHYSAPRGWLNDPNGLVYYEGEYHLFYQYHPHSALWGPMHWGHAVSTDLIHWETLPIALYPDPLGTIFSGAVVVDADNTSGLVPDGGLVALFSYNTQAQGVAYSTDRGRTWTKYGGNPIIPALRPDFRDPKVLRHGDQWIMALAAGRSIMFLTSPDLLHWEVASEFRSSDPGGVWEVPDLFPLTVDGVMKWVLIISIGAGAPAGGSGTRYVVGSFDGKTFAEDSPGEILWLDRGPDNYAGTTFNNVADGRRLFIAWMNNWVYANQIPTSIWRGAMTIPRELSLIRTPKGYRLAQRPAKALNGLRVPLGHWQDTIVEGSMALGGLCGRTLDIEMDVEPGNAAVFGLELSSAPEESVRIAYDVHRRQLVLHRPQASIPQFSPTFSAPLGPLHHRLRMRVLVDRSSVEVIANDGLLCMTSQVYLASDERCVRLFAQDGAALVHSLSAYHLRSIWSERA